MKSDRTTITNNAGSFFLFIYTCYLIVLISALNLLKSLNVATVRHKLNTAGQRIYKWCGYEFSAYSKCCLTWNM